MAHELATKNGKASMAYVGEKPWHGLGQELTEGASVETWVKEAGMDYEVVATPAAYQVGKQVLKFDDRNVLYRSDDLSALGFVSTKYNVVQPVEIVEFFRDLAEEHGFQLETAGVLFGGKKYWALARTPKEFSIGKDKVRAHLMLATACDGSMATVAKYVATRVVCNNTLTMALGENGAGQVKTRHSSKFKATSVKEELQLFSSAWSDLETNVKALSKRKISYQEALSILVQTLGNPEKSIEEQTELPTLLEVMNAYQGKTYIGANMASCDETAWGLVNAVTEYVDHHKGRDQNRRLNNAWFGFGVDMKQRAFDAAMATL